MRKLYLVVLLSATLHGKNIETPWMTVFIHGIVRPPLTLSTLFSILRDELHGTTYARTAAIIRRNPFFYQTQPMQDLGLIPITNHTRDLGAGAWPFMMLFKNIAEKVGFGTPQDIYYTYGWSGLLSAQHRCAEAQLLHDSLCSEQKKITEKTGVSPRIRLIGYSHGGSLCLNLELARRKNPACTPLIVDELITIGTPVLRASAEYASSKIFKQVYTISSAGDMVQSLEIGSTKFYHNGHFSCGLPPNLTQIKIRLCDEQETEVVRKKRSRTIRYIRKTLTRMDPGHIEIWAFGWTPSLYRKNLPIYPLPVGLFIPAIIACVEKNLPCTTFVTCDLRPSTGTALLSVPCRKRKRTYSRVPFLDKQYIASLQAQALTYMPHNQFHAEYDRRVNHLTRLARMQRLQDYLERKKQRQQKKVPATCEVCSRVTKSDPWSTVAPATVKAQDQNG